MPIKLQGQHSFPAPREVVWRALVDPQILARTLPGAERLVEVAENRFEGQINLRIGPVQGQFAGSVALSEVRPLEGYRLELKGQGAPGFVEGAGRVWLEDGPEGTTVLHYDVDSQVGGRIAGVGQRLLDSSAKVLTRQALEGLEKQIAALAPAVESSAPGELTGAAPAAAAPSPVPAAPSQAAFASEFVKGLAGEMVPRDKKLLIWLGPALALVGIAVLVVMRGCGTS